MEEEIQEVLSMIDFVELYPYPEHYSSIRIKLHGILEELQAIKKLEKSLGAKL